jgi:hypothetical protein
MGCLAQSSRVTSEQGLECIAKILQQMPPVGNLKSLWGSVGCSSLIGIPTVATDNFDAGMLLQPCCNDSLTALRQEVNWSVLLQVDQNGAKPTSATKRSVVNAQHAWR